MELNSTNNLSVDSSFTVLMAVYEQDDPVLFRKALDSVYANSVIPSEIVLVQDGPVGSGLSQVIDDYNGRENFNCIRLEYNKGLATALNVGLGCVNTKYVFRADADDYNLPDRFSKQLKVLQQGYDLVGCTILEVNELNLPIAVRRPPADQLEIRKFILKRNPFNHMTVAFRLDSVIKVGGYPSIYLKEDYALWAKLVSIDLKVCNMSDILVHASAGRDMYRRRGGIKYVKSEIEMQSLLVNLGLKNVIDSIVIGVARSVVFLLPLSLRGFIYEQVLRDKA